MIIKILLKIWPALIPILTYLFWVLVVEKIVTRISARQKNFVRGQYKIVGQKSSSKPDSPGYDEGTQQEKIGKFSLKNKSFITLLYVSFLLVIFSLIYKAISG